MKLRSLIISGCAAVAAITLSFSHAHAQEWGTLKGRFVVSGNVPELEPLNPTKDQFCIATPPPNETVVVGENNGLANVIVTVLPGRNETLAVHPDYAAAKEQPVVLDNQGCRFSPHVCLVQTGQPLTIKNSDPIAHNTNATLLRNGSFNELLPQGEERTRTFTISETLPGQVACNIHPYMKGYLLVREDPYMVVSGADGSFEIKNMPAGEHEFLFWHETGYLRDVKVGEVTVNRRGRADLSVPAGGELDLGDITVLGSSLTP